MLAAGGSHSLSVMTRRFSVLLVEDDDPLRSCLSELISAWGWSVYPTASGPEAIELARQIQIDFSLLDLHLPGMTGIEVLRQIRREVRPLPSIMMSGQASPEEAHAALSAGVFQFLRKPLDLDNLREAMQTLIRHHFEAPPGSPPPRR